MANTNIIVGGHSVESPACVYKTVIIKPNATFVSQVTLESTKYVVKYNFDLDGNRVTIPANCIIKFDGGSIDNGTLSCNGTYIYIYSSKDRAIGKDLVFSGEYWLKYILMPDEESLIENEEAISIKDNGVRGRHLNEDVVDDDSLELQEGKLCVKKGGIHKDHLDSDIADDEDLHFTDDMKLQFKDKEYNMGLCNGLGRKYLRKNMADGYPSKTWYYTKKGSVVYLLYSHDTELYAVYTDGQGLGLEHNVVTAPVSYNIADVSNLVGNRYLPFNYNEGVFTITLPDDSTVTSTELNNTEMYSLDYDRIDGVNVLTQAMVCWPNTMYVIQYDYDLAGAYITVPEGCVIKFDGGSLSNGTLVGQETYLSYCGMKKDVLKVTLEGTFTDNYYTKDEIESRIEYGTEADYETKTTPNDYEKGDVFYTAHENGEAISVVYYIAKDGGLTGANLTDTELFESTGSVIDAVDISSNIKFSEVEELENYYDKTEIDSQTAVNRNIAAIMALSAMPGLQDVVTVTSNEEYKLVYLDSEQRVLLGKRQDNSWYYPNNLDEVVDALIDAYDDSQNGE